MAISTGRLPVKLGGGRVMKPRITRASKLVHWIGTAAANDRASRPGAVVSVQRVTAFVSRSIDHTSLGLCAELRLNAIYYRLRGPSVVINGKNLKIGESIEGAKVTDIQRTSVELEFGGQKKALSLQ